MEAEVGRDVGAKEGDHEQSRNEGLGGRQGHPWDMWHGASEAPAGSLLGQLETKVSAWLEWIPVAPGSVQVAGSCGCHTHSLKPVASLCPDRQKGQAEELLVWGEEDSRLE